jgi:hypothetical protein
LNASDFQTMIGAVLRNKTQMKAICALLKGADLSTPQKRKIKADELAALLASWGYTLSTSHKNRLRVTIEKIRDLINCLNTAYGICKSPAKGKTSLNVPEVPW